MKLIEFLIIKMLINRVGWVANFLVELTYFDENPLIVVKMFELYHLLEVIEFVKCVYPKRNEMF